MRRALVLSDESARHPFRASLPQHVRRPLPVDPAAPAWDEPYLRLRQFASAYAACLVAALIFFA